LKWFTAMIGCYVEKYLKYIKYWYQTSLLVLV
jgi:hypothetical protein